MSTSRQLSGSQGEKLVRAFYKDSGYTVVEANYRAQRWGEIDLICEKKGVLAFVEVRSKQSWFKGSPVESFTYFKQRSVMRSALWYIQTHRQYKDYQWQIHFVSVGIDHNGSPSISFYQLP